MAVASGGQIYTSTDAGATWDTRESTREWSSVASSADGTRLVATVQGGHIYTSIDAGANWATRESNRSWSSVASSADGAKLVAGTADGHIYTSSSKAGTTPGTAGSISGGQYDSIELQYLGNGTFTVLSHEGSLTLQ